MQVSRSITAKQAKLAEGALQALNKIVSDFNIVQATLLAGLDVEGQIVAVDTDKSEVTIEVPDISGLEKEA